MTHLAIDAMGSYAHNVPVGTPTVLGYDTGSGGVQWSSGDWARFPHSGHGHINQDGDTSPFVGSIFDIESGAGTVDKFAQWAFRCRDIGKTPIGYGGLSTLSTLESWSRGDLPDGWLFWLARPGIGLRAAESLLSARVRAVQYAWPTTDGSMLVPGSHMTLSQANVDVSICADDFFPPPASRKMPNPLAVATVGVNVDDGQWQVHPIKHDAIPADRDMWWEAHVGFNRHTGEWHILPMAPENK